MDVISEMIRIFGKDQVFLVDSKKILDNPQNEFKDLVNFFGLDFNLQFSMNNQSGFHCLSTPIDMCLGDTKGFTKMIKKG